MIRRVPSRVGAASLLGAALVAGLLLAAPSPDIARTATTGATLLTPYQAPGGTPNIAIAGRRWNVVVVMTDDQNRDQTLDMPYLRGLITRRGVQYPNAFVQTSTCCPSRASFLTGRLIAGHGVQDNEATGAPGGFRVFRRNGNERRTLAVELKRAGYTTGLFGKYLNEYGPLYRGGKPPGWDTWRAFTSLETGSGYRSFSATFPRGRNGRLVSRAFPGGYSTRWAGNQAAQFIRQAPRNKPVFAVYTPFAPHSPAKPEPKYRGTLSDDGWWLRDRGFSEAASEDKPLWMRRKIRQQLADGGRFAQLAVRQRETLRSVDDQIANLVSTLRRTGRWNRTLLIFLSDNGLMNGVHGERSKYVPHRRATEVPLMVRYGRDLPPLTDGRVVAANVDVAATILAVAGRSDALARIDGIPLVGPTVRDGVPLAGSLRDDDGFAQRPPYCGWRTADAMYVRYGSGEEEFYDYPSDPYELHNLATEPEVADRVDQLRQRARQFCARPPSGYGRSFDWPTWSYRREGEAPRTGSAALVPPTGFKRIEGMVPER